MADLRDEHGNRIQLTDELGNPVTLTDERGNPMHLTGIATTHPPDVVEVQEVTISTAGMDAGLTHGGGMVAAQPPTQLEKEVVGTGMGQDIGLNMGLGQVLGGTGISPSGPEVGLGQGHIEKPKERLGKLLDQEETREERHQPLGEVVNRSNSTTSSSSSEDDGEGGRRKTKGLKEKLKEKLTIGGGKHSKEEHRHTDETATAPVEHHEKKSMMEKIKEKLPGGHHNHNH